MDKLREVVLIFGIADVLVGLLFVGLAVRIARRTVPSARRPGARTSPTVRDPEAWRRINQYAGARMARWGEIIAACGAVALVIWAFGFAASLPGVVWVVLIVVLLAAGAIGPLIPLFQASFYSGDEATSQGPRA